MASANASASGHPATATARVPATKAAEPSASSTRGGDVERGADDEAGGRDASPAPPPTLASVASLLSARRNVVVLAGAGISVSRGIPDFRSPDGLYRTLDCAALGLTCPEDLFDLEAFRDDPVPFWTWARTAMGHLWCSGAGADRGEGGKGGGGGGAIEPGPSHDFLAWLDGRGQLLRVYTQNIDGLEAKAGVTTDRVVYAHGTMATATCLKCKAKYRAGDLADQVEGTAGGRVPRCIRPRKKRKMAKPSPSGSSSDRAMDGTAVGENLTEGATSKATASTTALVPERAAPRRARPRRACAPTLSSVAPGAAARSDVCGGTIKPDVTFFGEKLGTDVGRRLRDDARKADALIVVGTSLSVAPMSRVVDYLPRDMPRILVNRNVVRAPRTSKEDGCLPFHACLLGNCDGVMESLRAEMTGGRSDNSRRDACEPRGLPPRDRADECWLLGQPRETVLLFPGAQVGSGVSGDLPLPDSEQNIVVHCDECQQEIEGTIYSCRTCFDYDLCEPCLLEASKRHADGKHEFIGEG